MYSHELQWLWLDWRSRANEQDEAVAATLRECADDLRAALLGQFDYTSSASRQHYIETGRYLKHGEAE